ncbi:MAG: extracellular solute-binding protein [Candidatus Binatia bacterium]
MAKRFGNLMIFLCFLVLALLLPHHGFSAPLPKSTQEMLKKLNLDPSILSGVDQELQVPKEWIEMARKEGKLRMLSSGRPLSKKSVFAPFKERYPFIEVEFSSASRRVRTVKTLMAYKRGRIITDILDSPGSAIHHFKQANALEDLRSIPTVKMIPKEAIDPEGSWVGINRLHWCIAYNKRLVKEQELPKRWDDLLTNPRWRGGNVGMGNRPNLWVLNLWKAQGEGWTKNFLTKLFSDVKPQLRKEGLTAILELAAAGEFHLALPANNSSTNKRVMNGAPLGFSCPEPVPVSVEDIVILKGAPNVNAAKIFINWTLSKEGQIARYFSFTDPPVRTDLQRPEFIPFVDQIVGKQVSYRDPALLVDLLPEVTEFWNSLWLGGGGKPRR